MPESYLKGAASTRRTPQSEPIPGAGQVPNSAGGHAWAVTGLERLRRFLVLGSEGGSYYAGQRELTLENALAVREALDAHGPAAVHEIVAVSVEGHAPRQDPALFALAVAAGHPRDDVRRAALDALPAVARTGTALFHFLEFVQDHRGWGRGLKRAVGDWYNRDDVAQVAYQAVKYRQRDGWTHRDALRLAKPKPATAAHNELFAWITGSGEDLLHRVLDGGMMPRPEGLPLPLVYPELRLVEGYARAQRAESPGDVAALVVEYGLPREALSTEHLGSPVVWDAMLNHGGKHGMPITALIRNLATMTRVGLLDPTSAATRTVVEKLTAPELLSHARVHPFQVLLAARTYAAGRGLRGSNTWAPVPAIVDALDAAFYLAFGNLEPTGNRRLIALDVSGSMWRGEVAGVPGLTPAEAAGAMALASMATGDPYEVVAFTAAGGYRGALGTYRPGAGPGYPPEVVPGLSVHPLSARQRLDDVASYMRGLSPYMGATDCALPMLYANSAGREFDLFEIFTDNETWHGDVHPAQALRAYRENRGIEARLVVYGMVSNGFSIADPDDAGMLDVVGLDASAPQVVADFAAGRL